MNSRHVSFSVHLALGSAAAVAGLLGACTDPESVITRSEESAFATNLPVTTQNGVLVFRDEQSLQETLSLVGRMDGDALQQWNRQMGFTSLREIFNEVTVEEAAIDDFYQLIAASSPVGWRFVPTQAVRSHAYDAALQNAQFQVIDDGDGGYLYYSIRNSYLASVLDPQGRIAVGGVLTQHLPGGIKRVKYSRPEGFAGALAALPDAPLQLDKPSQRLPDGEIEGKALEVYASDWFYSSRPGNGWDTHGSRRFRTWIEGDSQSQFDAEGRQELYVRNVLRIQGMKKNIFGSWGFRETYTTYVDIDWSYSYLWQGQYHWDLPVPASTNLPPMSWSSSYVNDATLPLSPHINGHYLFSCTSCGHVDAVIPGDAGGLINIYGVQLNPGEYQTLNTYP